MGGIALVQHWLPLYSRQVAIARPKGPRRTHCRLLEKMDLAMNGHRVDAQIGLNLLYLWLPFEPCLPSTRRRALLHELTVQRPCLRAEFEGFLPGLHTSIWKDPCTWALSWTGCRRPYHPSPDLMAAWWLLSHWTEIHKAGHQDQVFLPRNSKWPQTQEFVKGDHHSGARCQWNCSANDSTVHHLLCPSSCFASDMPLSRELSALVVGWLFQAFLSGLTGWGGRDKLWPTGLLVFPGPYPKSHILAYVVEIPFSIV